MAEMPQTTKEETDGRVGKSVYEVSAYGKEDQINEGKNIIWTPNYY